MHQFLGKNQIVCLQYQLFDIENWANVFSPIITHEPIRIVIRLKNS